MSSAAAQPREGVLGHRYRTLTVGLITSVTLVAFLWLGVATVLPLAAAELDGISQYGWAFTAFMLASLFGTVVSGQGADRRGPIGPYLQAFAVFAVGCVISAAAPSWLVLLLGRALQGYGVGGVLALAYLTVGRAYPDNMRAKMLALVASAWTLPALLGPVIAGVIADLTDWRVVFLVVAPLVIPAVLMTLPGLRGLEPPKHDGSSSARRILLTALMVLGVGMLMVGLQNRSLAVLAVLVVVGCAIALPPLLKLLPPGTLTVRRGMPAGMVVRGLVSTAYYGGEAFFPLSMVAILGLNTIESGLALSAGALTWVGGAWVQAKLDQRDEGAGRHRRVVFGFILLGIGDLAIAVAVGSSVASVALAVGGWAVAGAGMGLVYPAVTTIVLSQAEEGQEGAASSNLQLSETLSVAVMTGLGTAIMALGAEQGFQQGVLLGTIFVIVGIAALLGIIAGNRTVPHSGAQPGEAKQDAEQRTPIR